MLLFSYLLLSGVTCAGGCCIHVSFCPNLLSALKVTFIILMPPGTRVLVQLSPHFHGRVTGLCGNFDGDVSNDLRSRQGVLEPTAELTAHSWRLNPLCPEPGDLPHPCSVSRAG